jgi:hypothetical protein
MAEWVMFRQCLVCQTHAAAARFTDSWQAAAVNVSGTITVGKRSQHSLQA